MLTDPTKLLILFTSNYPNSVEEVFVENEIYILEKYFDKIIIICAVDINPDDIRYIPENAEVLVFNENISVLQKLKSIRFLFSNIFWNEISYCRKILKIKTTFPRLKILLVDLIKGYLLGKYTKKIIQNHASFSDVFLYSYWWDYKAIACTFLKTAQPDIITFCRAHRFDIYFYTQTDNYLPMKKFMAERLNAVFFISEDGKKYAQEVLGLHEKTFFVSRLGTFNRDDLLKPGNFADTLQLVSCSLLLPVKRVGLIIDALSLIHNIRIKWSHFGDGIMMNQLKEYAQKLISNQNIQFEFKGQTSNEDILKYYSDGQFDLLINVSQSEGLPVSIMEALSYKIPVIATGVGGTPEIVKDGYNGFLLSADATPEEVAENIKKYYFLPGEEKLKMRENAFRTWDEEYNAEKNYKDFVKSIMNL